MKILKTVMAVFVGVMVVSSVRAGTEIGLEKVETVFEKASSSLIKTVCKELGSGEYIKSGDNGIMCEGVKEAVCKDIVTVSAKYGMKIITESLGDVCKIFFDKEQSGQ